MAAEGGIELTRNEATWATAHLVRYAEPMTATKLGSVAGPESALTWFYGPNREDANTSTEQVKQALVWGGVGYYPGRVAAESVFDDPADVVPALGDAVEAWHALLVPIQHRGEFRFCERGRNDELNTAAGDPNPGGPLIVITSTGYVTDASLDIRRVEALLTGVAEVRQGMAGTDGMIAQHSMDNPNDELDGITFSIGKGERAMQAFAYSPGRHRGQLDRHGEQSMFDRSAFTRLRPVRSAGLWNGVNPVNTDS